MNLKFLILFLSMCVFVGIVSADPPPNDPGDRLECSIDIDLSIIDAQITVIKTNTICKELFLYSSDKELYNKLQYSTLLITNKQYLSKTYIFRLDENCRTVKSDYLNINKQPYNLLNKHYKQVDLYNDYSQIAYSMANLHSLTHHLDKIITSCNSSHNYSELGYSNKWVKS